MRLRHEWVFGSGATKAGIVGLTRSLVKGPCRNNVNVSAVAYAFILTRFTDSRADGQSTIEVGSNEIKVEINPSVRKATKSMIPLGRAQGRPRKRLARWLCAPIRSRAT